MRYEYSLIKVATKIAFPLKAWFSYADLESAQSSGDLRAPNEAGWKTVVMIPDHISFGYRSVSLYMIGYA